MISLFTIPFCASAEWLDLFEMPVGNQDT